MKLVVDLDSIVVNLVEGWFGRYNAEYNDNLTMGQIKEWDTSKFVKPECGKKIFDYLAIPGFFEGLNPLPGAIEALSQLRSDGYSIVLCSATEVPEAAKGKMIWVKTHLPFIAKYDLVLTHGKYHVPGDCLIDDSPSNAELYRAKHPQAVIMSIKYPYNENCHAYDFLAGDWENTETAWHQMYGYLRSTKVR